MRLVIKYKINIRLIFSDPVTYTYIHMIGTIMLYYSLPAFSVSTHNQSFLNKQWPFQYVTRPVNINHASAKKSPIFSVFALS